MTFVQLGFVQFLNFASYFLLYSPEGSYLVTSLSQSLVLFFTRCLMTFSEATFCLSLHFEQPVASASGSVFLSSRPSFVHDPSSIRQLMYCVSILWLLRILSISMPSYFLVYSAARTQVTPTSNTKANFMSLHSLLFC
uniref:Chemosensory protein 10 n=1 Tax=Subpsaltria yangi TaxID=1195109 RepID=A0A385IUR5_9HEMI|nr:chemosensory protein 10 [Subpsaltria yangi]